MLMMLMEQSQAPVAPAARRPSPGAAISDAAAMAANPLMQQARELVQAARNDRELLARMRRQGAADLAAAVEAGDLANVVTHLQRLMDQRRQAEAAARQAEFDLANADPFDPAVQARIAEQVRRGSESRTAREGARVVEAETDRPPPPHPARQRNRSSRGTWSRIT